MTGSGTELDPYIIGDVNDLQDVVNDLDAYYELGGDIDASATSSWNGGQGFAPIGSFEGDFDGKSHTIWGLYINRTQSGVGLFIGPKTGAYIHNFYIRQAEVHGTYVNTGTIAAGAAILCGVIFNQSPTISRVGVYGTCSLATNSTNEYTFGAAGGIAGYTRYTDAQISECYSAVSVSVTGLNKAVPVGGGFIGVWDGDLIENAYSRCNVTVTGPYLPRAGGFVGYHDGGTIGNAYSTGAPTADTIGGFSAYKASGTVTACFWDIQTSGTGSSPGGGTGKTTAQMQTEATYTDAGWDFATVWSMDDGGYNDGYPILLMLPAQAGSEGYLWVEGTELAYTGSDEIKRTTEGTLDGATGQTAGYLWVEGNNLRYIDSIGNERYIAGSAGAASGQTPGHIWIETTTLRYIDSSGNERYYEGT